MSNIKENDLKVRFISLPPMRMVWLMAIGILPEDEAMMSVLVNHMVMACVRPFRMEL